MLHIEDHNGVHLYKYLFKHFLVVIFDAVLNSFWACFLVGMSTWNHLNTKVSAISLRIERRELSFWSNLEFWLHFVMTLSKLLKQCLKAYVNASSIKNIIKVKIEIVIFCSLHAVNILCKYIGGPGNWT